MIDPKLRETLLKIQELTKSPNDGESAAAQRKLRHLLTKHGLTEADLEDGVGVRWFKFGYWNNIQRDILHHICTKVMRTNEIKWIRLQSSCQIEMTPEQFAVIDTAYNYYCKVFDREFKVFFDAFIYKNSLYNPEGEEAQAPDDHLRKVRGSMEHLDDVAVPGTVLGKVTEADRVRAV